MAGGKKNGRAEQATVTYLGANISKKEVRAEGRRLIRELVSQERVAVTVSISAAILGAAFEGIVNLFSSAEGVDMAALLREEGDGEWRVSLRSGGRCDVREVALAMGGGGHRRAAAFSSGEERAALEARLLAAMGRELERATGEGR